MPLLSNFVLDSLEADTLDSVTDRGATTTNAITVGNLTSTGIDDNATSTAITIDSSENVGIGTTTPNQLLTLGTDTGNATIGLDFETATTVRGSILYDANAGEMAFTSGYSGYGGYMTFDCNGSERMRIDSDGNVGIGTSSPSARLHIRDDVGSDSVMRIRNENTTSRTTTLQLEDYSGALADGVLKFVFPNAGSTTDSYLALLYNSAGLYVAPGGNVGIGDTTPDSGLTVHNNAGAVIATSNIARQTYTSIGNLQVSTAGSGGILIHTNSTTAQGALTFGDGTYAGRLLYDHSDNSMAFITNASEKMELSSGGTLTSKAPQGTANFSTSATTATIANNGTVSFQNFSGMIIVNNQNSGSSTAYVMGGGSITELGSSNSSQKGVWSYSSGTTSYVWTNNTGVSRVISFMAFKTRNFP